MTTRSREFTTYINIKPGQSNAKDLARMEQQAKDSLNRIARISQSASLTSRGQSGRATPGSLQAMAAAERSRAQAIQRSVAAQNANAVAAARSQAVMSRGVTTTRAATREVNRLERALRSASIAANVAQGPLGPIAGRISAIGNAVGTLSGFQLGFVGAGAGIAAFGRFASRAEDLKSQLFPLFEAQSDVNRAWRESLDIANQARISVEPVVELYSRLTLAGRDAGLQIGEITQLTDIASKAARLSGGTSVSQGSGLTQFAQGIGSQTLQGDELRSVRENTLRLAKAIADGLGVPISKLKELGKEGELTPRVIADALISQSDRINEELSRLPPTITASTTNLSNAFTAYISESNEATGVTTAFATVINALADNLDVIGSTVFNAAIAWGSYRAATSAINFASQIRQTAQQTVETRRQMRTVIAAAQARRDAALTTVQSLQRERTAVAQRIRSEQQLADETRKTALAVQQRLKSSDVIGDPRSFKVYNDSLARARVAQDNLAASKNRLRNVSTQLDTATATLTNRSRRLARVQGIASRASNSFSTALRNVFSATNILGTAVAVAIPLIINMAFSQDAAAASSDRMAEAQNELARYVDLTTGKIREQSVALREQRALLREQAAEEAREREDFQRGRATSFRPRFFGEIDERVQEVQRSVANGTRTAEQAVQELIAIRDFEGGLTSKDVEEVNDVISALGAVSALSDEASRAEAEARLLRGQGTDGDLDLLRGRDFSELAPSRTPAGDVGKKGGGTSKKVKDDSAKRLREEERRLDRVEKLTDRRADTLARYDAQSNALDRALRDARELDQVVGQAMNGIAEISEENPLGEGIYTQEMADADRARIFYGLRQPIRDAIEEEQNRTELLALRAEGYSLEADALETALSIQREIGEVTEDELRDLIEERRHQEEINDQLQSRERIMGQILDASRSTRQEVEDLIVNFRRDPVGALKQFGDNILDNVIRIQARQITEKIFEGADAKLRDLVDGGNGVERATQILKEQATVAADSHKNASTGVQRLASATDEAANKIIDAANRVASGTVQAADVPSVGAAGLVAGDPQSQQLDQITRTLGALGSAITGGSIFAAATVAIKASGALSKVAGLQGEESGGEITVTGERSEQRRAPTSTETYNTVFEAVGAGLDKILGSGGTFEGLGRNVGTVLAGAAKGQISNTVLSTLGLPSSRTGAAIGGALGSVFGPAGSLIGGALGGLTGGLLKGTKRGSATIGGAGDGLSVVRFGGNGSRRQSSTGLAGTVIDQVNQIAAVLGATVDASRGSVSIGTRKDDFRVDTSGRGQTKTSKGAIDFGQDEQAAITFAVQDLITDGVITGISAAAQNILRAGGDLEEAITKAAAIEAIPRRLLEFKDPVRFAVEELNAEFSTLIGYLKEGGATAEQFADAQELYDLERAQAIENATQQSVDVIQQYIDEITGGASSPFNRRDTFENATSQVDQFRAAIASGEAVDSSDLIDAIRNQNEAARALEGSGQAFFDIFNSNLALLEQARDNQLGSNTGSVEDLPGSPFETDATVANLLSGTNDAINGQTGVLGGYLADILASLNGQGTSGTSVTPSGSSVSLLPGFGGGGNFDIGRTLNLV